MDAHCLCRAWLLLPLLLSAMGANYETANFSVSAPCASSARQYAETAEQYRKELAILWLGTTLPDWSAKCPVKVHVGNDLGAGGQTSFVFEKGEVFDWEMEIQGPHERILDSVLPHEITHMILASHFRKPIPRWLDEGAATAVEHLSEKEKYRSLLRHFLQPHVQRCFPFNKMVSMKDYPADSMPFYAQGFSLVEYLLEYGRQFDEHEHRRLVGFAQSAMDSGDWNSALHEHYGVPNLGELQLAWVKWVNADDRALRLVADAPAPILQTTNVSPVVSAKPVPPPSGKSVYDRSPAPGLPAPGLPAPGQVETIPTNWNDEKPVLIPVSYGQNIVRR